MSYSGSPFTSNSDYQNTGTYFAADESNNTVHYLTRKSQEWFHNTRLNGYLDKIRRSWSAYHGSYYELAHDISYGGEQGELVDLAINHYRNIGQLMLIMVTSTRPSFKARAINTDRKSLVQASLATGILDYYLREKRLERELKRATEYAIVLGSGFIKMEWNSTKGEIYDYLEIDEDKIEKYDEDDNPIDKDGNKLKKIPIYEGDVEFKTLSPYDVVFDSTKETPEQHDWVLCRTFVNKYDLIAKYPEKKEQILEVQTKDIMQGNMVAISAFDSTTDVPVYEFFHKRTEAIPEGRHVLYLEHDLVLSDGPMPYRDLPIFRIAPADMLGTPYGYTTLWDTLPIQDAINSLYSTIMTNQNAFAVQNILNPRGNDIKVNQLEGSLNFIEYNAQAGKPEPLNLTNTPGEVFNFLQMLERAMETVSAMNSVVRGNPEKSLDSGNALALVQSQAIQFMSGLQQSYVQLLEDVGTGLINLLRDFAKVPRIAAIMGINNRTRMKEFTGDDLSTINRVHVDIGNALSQTSAGRVQMAEQLLQMGAIKSPEKYLQVINTGNFDALVEGELNELDTVKDENESLILDESVVAIATDEHDLHIREHKAVISDPEVRRSNPELVQRTTAHIMEHIELLRTTDPELLTRLGQQPAGPPMGTPTNVAQPGQMPAGTQGAGEAMVNPDMQGQIALQEQLTDLPQPARPAGDPTQPTTPQENLARLGLT